MEETSPQNYRAAESDPLTLADLETTMEQWRSLLPSAESVVSWEIAADLWDSVCASVEEARFPPLGGQLVRVNEFCPLGYAVGRDAAGNVVKIIGPEKTITVTPRERQFWGR